MKKLLAVFILAFVSASAAFGQVTTRPRKTLGTLSANPYTPESTSNPYGIYGSKYSPNSINNPYGIYGSKYSPTSVNNPYAVQAPKIYGRDGTYLGRLSKNKYDPESVSNPYGVYGSKYSPKSINNPYGIYGSPYSPLSPNNPYSVSGPKIVSGEGNEFSLPKPSGLSPGLKVISPSDILGQEESEE